MLEGERIRLWAVEKQELLNNYIWGNDRELIHLAGMNPFPKSYGEIDRWYEQVVANPNGKVFSIKSREGDYLGNIEISGIDWRIGRGEIGLAIGDRRARGKGYGEEAVRLLSRFAFDELKFHRLSARVIEYNEKALSLFTRCGFRKEGRERDGYYGKGRYWDVILFGLLEREFRQKSPPRAPTAPSGKD